MGTSSITITALTATPTLRGNKLAAAVSATGPAANIPTLMLAAVEFFASTTNDFTTATKVVEGNPEAIHVGLIEEQTYYYWAKPRAVNGSYGAVYPVSPTGGVACSAIGLSTLAFGIANCKIVPSVAANALTIAFKTLAGNDPSATDPIFIAFRNAALANGASVTRQITAALSLVIPSGAAFSANGSAFRIWFGMFDDAGTIRPAVVLCAGGSAVLPLPDAGIYSCLSISFSGFGVAGTLYASQVVTSKAFRALGYLEWTTGLATGGLWTAVPDIIQFIAPGTKRPGDIIQLAGNTYAGTASGTPSIPLDNTAPQDSEGLSVLSAAITPKSAANSLRIESVINLARSSAGQLICTLFRDSSANTIQVALASVNAADVLATIACATTQPANTTSQVTITQRFGGSGGATVYVNSNSGGQLFNGFCPASLAITELQG